MVHARLEEGAVRADKSLPAFHAAWREFVRPDDVICHWGPYSNTLAEEAGLALSERRIDIRKVVGDVQKKRPGSLEDVVSEHELSHQSLGLGRAGERLGMLAAVTVWLASMMAAGHQTEIHLHG